MDKKKFIIILFTWFSIIFTILLSFSSSRYIVNLAWNAVTIFNYTSSLKNDQKFKDKCNLKSPNNCLKKLKDKLVAENNYGPTEAILIIAVEASVLFKSDMSEMEKIVRLMEINNYASENIQPLNKYTPNYFSYSFLHNYEYKMLNLAVTGIEIRFRKLIAEKAEEMNKTVQKKAKYKEIADEVNQLYQRMKSRLPASVENKPQK